MLDAGALEGLAQAARIRRVVALVIFGGMASIELMPEDFAGKYLV